MIGLDTNILIRFITEDDSKQAKKAAMLLEKQCSVHEPGFITSVVLCELVWVLLGGYNYSKESIISLLRKFLTTSELLIEHQDSAIEALQDYSSGNADFSDYYIAHISKKFGVKKVYTFDKKAGKQRLFELIG